jgi:hypothetical protein
MTQKLAAAFFFVSCQLALAWAPDSAGPVGDLATPSVERANVRAQRSLRQWLDRLSFAESTNREWITHQDRDGRNYYGCLQFRESTFRFFVKKYNLAPDAEESEVMDLMFDCEFQKRVAGHMLRDNPENWKHWKFTVGRIGLPPGARPRQDESAAIRPNTAVSKP